jgi:hypothetical protein
MLTKDTFNLKDIFSFISFLLIIYSVHLLNIYKIWGPNENAVIGLLACLFFLACSLKRNNQSTNTFFKGTITYYEKLLVVALGSAFCIISLQYIIAPYPMDKTNSDVIPQINILVNRFLSGEYPYTEIDFKTYKLFPTYLPIQWLPFSIAEVFGIDYRIFALFLLLISLSFFLYKINYRPYFYISSILVFALLILGMQYNKDDYFNCVENIIAAFYLAFALSLLYTKKVWIQILFLSLCLFSRYSIILWVPIYFLYIFLNQGLYSSLKAIGMLFLVFLTVYGIPFLIKDPFIFFKAYKYHTGAAIGEWKVESSCNNCKPYHLNRGLGLAIFFYDNQSNLAYRLSILQKVHLYLSLLSVGATALYLVVNKNINKKNISAHLIIWSLALYLTIFYNFIQIPYHYLFSVPMVLYMVLFQSYFMHDKLEKNN